MCSKVYFALKFLVLKPICAFFVHRLALRKKYDKKNSFKRLWSLIIKLLTFIMWCYAIPPSVYDVIKYFS